MPGTPVSGGGHGAVRTEPRVRKDGSAFPSRMSSPGRRSPSPPATDPGLMTPSTFCSPTVSRWRESHGFTPIPFALDAIEEEEPTGGEEEGMAEGKERPGIVVPVAAAGDLALQLALLGARARERLHTRLFGACALPTCSLPASSLRAD